MQNSPKSQSDKSGDATVRLAEIFPSPLNPRKTFDEDTISELADSIAARGLLQNLVLRPRPDGGYWIVAGERRWRAIRLLAQNDSWFPDEPNIPARIVHVDDNGALTLALLENLQRQNVNPMEEAEAMAALQTMNPKYWTATAIAKEVGVTPRLIQQRLALVKRLTPKVKTALRNGDINVTQARILADAPDDRQKELLARLEFYRSTDDLRRAVTRDLVPVSRACFPANDIPASQIVVTDNGEKYFVDRAWFMARQTAWADDERCRLLADGWNWVELNTAYLFPYFDYEPNRSPDRAASGVVIHIDPTGLTKVHEGLVVKDRAQQIAIQTAASEDAKEKNKLWNDFAAALAQHLHADPQMALRLFLLQKIHTTPVFMHDYGSGVNPDSVSSFPSFSGALADATTSNYQTLVYQGPDGSSTAWWALSKLPLNDLLTLLATAFCTNIATHRDVHLPVLRSLAHHYGVPVPEFLQQGAEDK